MGNEPGILDEARAAARRRVLFLPHAVRQMARPDRLISTGEVRSVVEQGEVIEHYPQDPRGHSCLILGLGESGRPIHVVCAPKEGYLAVITAYLPDPDEWSADFRTREEK